MTSPPLIAASGVVKGYRTAAGYVPVLEGVDLEVAPREMVAIVGASGVGKSTLLHVLGSLDRPEKGRVEIVSSRGACECVLISKAELEGLEHALEVLGDG